MITTFYPPHNFGGDGLFVQQLARDLVRTGHEVEVAHCVDAYRLKAAEPVRDRMAEADGVVVHHLRSAFGALSPILTQQTGLPLLKRAALARVLARGFDVVNFHNISLVGGPALLRMGRKALRVLTLHEHWWVCPTHVLWRYTGELCVQPRCVRCCVARRVPFQAWRLARGWRARCLDALDLLIAPSRFTAERHRAWMAAHRAFTPVEVVPGYAPPFSARGPRPGGLPRDYFLYVGRLSPEKGLTLLLDAFGARPGYPLVVVGDGPAGAELRARATRDVRWIGPVPRPELGAYYAGARALVFPSVGAETFGLTAVEAMSCGLPVITMPAGGVEEVVSPESGIVVRDRDEMLRAMDLLWADPASAQRMGRAARERFLEHYTPDAYLARYLAELGRAAARRRCSTTAYVKTAALDR